MIRRAASAFATIGFLLQALTAWTMCAPDDHPGGGGPEVQHAGMPGHHHSATSEQQHSSPPRPHHSGGTTCVCAGACQQLAHDVYPTTIGPVFLTSFDEAGVRPVPSPMLSLPARHHLLPLSLAPPIIA